MITGLAFLEILSHQIPNHFLLIFEIGLMIILAGVFGFMFRLIKQPLIPAYILAGIILGPLSVGLIHNAETILVLSEIGVAFLLFFAGLEINIPKLKEVGKAAVIGGALQIALLFTTGYFVSIWMGLIGRAPIYIGLVVAFSSTMIVLKLLADKKQLNSLHGRIVLGILLVQDIAAIIALTILTTDLTWASMGTQLAKALAFVIIAIILSKTINPIFRIAARSTELLLLISVTLLFLFAIGSYLTGLSLIIGAFFAGVVLANSEYKTEIQGRIISLRDFFAVLFFVALGMQLTAISRQFLLLLAVLIVLAMVVKPLVIMFLTRAFGFSKRTSFLTGNALAQTSEFSLIIATIGLTSGYITGELFSTVVLLTVITMAATSYLIGNDKRLYEKISWPLNALKRFHTKREDLEFNQIRNKRKIVIFGCHRIGSLFLKDLGKNKKDIFVVDFNPEIIRSLIKKKVPCIYGDFANSEVIEKANLREAEIVVSTIPDKEDNEALIKKVKEINKNIMIFATAERISDAEALYDIGADYVLLPKVITGEIGVNLVKRVLRNKKDIRLMRGEQRKRLRSVHKLLYD